ncbi:hypothetical protein O181_125398 [Austropuccinia psidii MF-1]|uniref:Uncharacterized protein n=1 Tax=Austropuccinia psidii MF-1 TaxID=1389203 RepID=A0A9Q3KQH8_9BASI|nr:hypothetical protein [Austropuccinia psidii MF-1]
MEASTIEVEPVQKKGLKPKQLVKMVSNRYGKNEINPTKIENRITEPEVEPKNQKLETNLSEEGSIQSQEPLGLDQEIEKLNFMELELERSTGSIGSESSQNNPFANLSPNCGLNSLIYVRIGWEEYPVMAIMNPKTEENILPLKIGLGLGMKPKKKHKTKPKSLMKKSIHKLSIEVEKSTNLQDIGIEEEGFSFSKEEEEGEKSLSTFKVNTIHSEGIYNMEHTHTANKDSSEENHKSFKIRKSKALNLFERDKKAIQETLESESYLFRDDIPDLFSGLLNQGNNLNNPCTFSKPEEEIQVFWKKYSKEILGIMECYLNLNH